MFGPQVISDNEVCLVSDRTTRISISSLDWPLKAGETEKLGTNFHIDKFPSFMDMFLWKSLLHLNFNLVQRKVGKVMIDVSM